MKLTAEQRRILRNVLAATETDVVRLGRIAGFEPARDYRFADWRGADFGSHDLSGFDFAGADVRGAIFSKASGIEPSMFVSAVWDASTEWPPDFQPSWLDVTWADAAGWDRYGNWASFSVPAAGGSRVTQRLRWCPPGRFAMGSPADEEGRFEWEGLQHEVTLAAGFWLFDTPCTQALWEAVMGDNPSEFVSPTRPVERVSFDDVQAFLAKVNTLVPALGLVLPSEAQWEYACRAGTSTATYAGEISILGAFNAPVLDGIAWYGGNSGVGFELENGLDSSHWSEKQYDHTRAGTRPVGTKRANAWGLYDMLGNVFEWCADHWHDSFEGAPKAGSAWVYADEGAAVRVIRGGSWSNDARHVRAACRLWSEPGDRLSLVGFRCARVQ